MPKNTPKTKPASEESYEERNARLAATLNLKDLDDRERAFLAICQKIHDRYTGCNSPFEEFINALVRYVARGEWPTPDDAARELETFREHFDDMRRDAAWFRESYPQVTPPTPESEAADIPVKGGDA